MYSKKIICTANPNDVDASHSKLVMWANQKPQTRRNAIDVTEEVPHSILKC